MLNTTHCALKHRLITDGTIKALSRVKEFIILRMGSDPMRLSL
jgi:hypothetical protein